MPGVVGAGVVGGGAWATVVVITTAVLRWPLLSAAYSGRRGAQHEHRDGAAMIAAAERQPARAEAARRAGAALQAPVLPGGHRRAALRAHALGAQRPAPSRRAARGGAPADPFDARLSGSEAAQAASRRAT